MGPTIRPADEGDADSVAGIYAPIVEETHVSFETDPPSVEEMTRRIRDTVERFPWLVCEHDGRVLGYAYAGPRGDRSAYQWGVDASVYVDSKWRRRGVARGLYESLFALLELQGFYNAYAVIALPNPPSVTLHESLGFERVGVYERAGYKLGEWHDVGHWELTIRPHDETPSPPTPLADLRGADGCERAIAAGESLLRV